jgi:ubiquinone/menaquinone biosynthesis C-methylase UbiE
MHKHPWPILDSDVDILIAPFSAYYTKDVPRWVDEALRVTKPGGILLLLGPTQHNACELYELNEAVSSIKSVAETDETTAKIEAEFLPEMRSRLGQNVKSTILDRMIVFPSPEEFSRYYTATMLYDRTIQNLGRPIPMDVIVAKAR